MGEILKVPVPPHDEPKSGNGLPNPELNPMTNPVLGQHLGLWAQVYFTSPPEKREEAVKQLLRDLESGVKSPPTPPPVAAPLLPTQAETTEAVPQELICPACLHRNATKQQFCGLCGFPLKSHLGETKLSILPVPEPPQPPPVDRKPDDWQWLHEKNVADLWTAKKPTPLWKYLLPLVAVLVAAAALYMIWNFRSAGASSPHPETPTTSPAVPSQNSGNTTPGQSETGLSAKPVNSQPSPEALEKSSPAEEEKNKKSPLPLEPASDSHLMPSSTSVPGGEEFNRGRNYLEGINGPKNTILGMQWLWRSVGKKNEDAVLLLSDLYARGNGIPKSCDQARVLLMAAVKRGSAAAGEKLKNINATDCR